METFLYRVILTAKNGDQFKNLLVEFPDSKTAELFVENPGDEGYEFTEVLLALMPDTKMVSLTELGVVTEKDSVLRWNLLKRSCGVQAKTPNVPVNPLGSPKG